MTLNSEQVSQFLARNATASRMVTEFDILVAALDWTQIPVNTAWDLSSLYDLIGVNSPIPPEGVAIQDSLFHTQYVVIYPDASGLLHFTAADSHGGAKIVAAGGSALLPSLPDLKLPSFNVVAIVVVLLALAAIVVYGAPIVERLIPARAA